MSEEKFKRSETGHSANDLHRHGGLDAREDKTERENLEEAIEALNDSEETENLVDIEKDMKGEDIEEIAEVKVEEVEAKPEEEPSDDVKAAIEELENDVAKEPIAMPSRKEEPVNSWKTKAENQAYMTIDTVETPKEKKKGGAGWKFAAVFFLLLAVAGCGTAAYLFFTDGKTELMGRVITSEAKESNSKNSAKKPSGNVSDDGSFDFEASSIDYSGVTKLIANNELIAPLALDYTKDGKYIYLIADIYGTGGYAATFYRENKKGAEWQILQSGQAFVTCDKYTDAQKKFMSDYKYIDDGLNSKYVGCYEAEGSETVYPE